MTTQLRIGLLVGWILAALQVLSQEVAYEHFRVGREVPFNTVYGQILQDSLGYLWMGTNSGLYRYDGQQFHHFPIESNITDEEILYYKLTSDGTFWGVNLARQIVFMKPGEDSLRLFNLSKLIEGKVLELNYASQNQLSLVEFHSTTPGILTFDIQLKAGTTSVASFSSKRYYDINNVYVAPDGKEYKLQSPTPTNAIYQIVIQSKNEESPSIIIPLSSTLKAGQRSKIRFLSHLNKVIITTIEESGVIQIYLFDHKVSSEYKVSKLTNTDWINNISDDSSGHIWIATNNGIIGYDQYLQPLLNGQRLFAGKIINTFFQDAEKGYWAGTEKDGLYYIPNLHVQFFTKQNSPLPSDNITVLHPFNDSSIYAGTLTRHLFEITPKSFTTMHRYDSQSQSNLFIRDIASFDNQLVVVFNTPHNYLYNIRTKKLTPLASASGAIKSVDTYKSQILIGRSNGTILSKPNDSSSSFRYLSKKRNTTLLSDKLRNLIWIGEIGGLKYFDFQSDSLLTFQDKGQGLPYYIVDIAQDDNAVIWVATASHGIFGLRPDSLLYHFTTDDGLLSNTCKKLMADGGQFLWIATDKGVSQLNLQTLQLQSINRADGLLIEEGTDLCRQGDQLWVGTVEGLFRIPVQQSYSSQYPPKISITKFKVWEQDSTVRSQYYLSSRANNLYIEFRAIHFKDKDQLQYRYRMLGIDSMWTHLDHHINFVSYPQLNHGEYRFEVAAENGDGLSSKIASIEINIQLPFWKRWWFLLTLALVFAGGYHLVFRSIRLRKAWKDQNKQHIEHLRLVALRSQMNPHFVFNTLNAILFYTEKNGWDKSFNYITKFSRLIRTIFDHAEHDLIPLSEEIHFLETYLELEYLRFIDRITIRKQIDNQLRNSPLLVPSMLLQPLLENAFKHGLFHKVEGGVLLFSIQKQENGVCFIIEDNGIGRAKVAAINKRQQRGDPHSSTILIEERIHLINSKYPADRPKLHLGITDLMNEEELPCGTRCELVIYH